MSSKLGPLTAKSFPLPDRDPGQHIGLEGQSPDDAFRVSDDYTCCQGHFVLLLQIDRFRNYRRDAINAETDIPKLSAT